MDFLTFKTFISSYVLIAFYYIGALIMPLFAWYFCKKILKKFNIDIFSNAKIAFSNLNLKYKLLIFLAFLFTFIFMEIIWRVMIEFLLAYIQIRDVLVG